jgi:hypothetical protein
MSRKLPKASNEQLDRAHRHDYLTRVTLGQDPETAAAEIGLPKSYARDLLSDPSSLVTMAQIQSRVSNSLASHGASLVSGAIQILDESLNGGTVDERVHLAAKVVTSSGILTGYAHASTDHLEHQVRIKELSDRLRFLTKLESIGVSEQEWTIAMRPAAVVSNPRGRPRKP